MGDVRGKLNPINNVLINFMRKSMQVCYTCFKILFSSVTTAGGQILTYAQAKEYTNKNIYSYNETFA